LFKRLYFDLEVKRNVKMAEKRSAATSSLEVCSPQNKKFKKVKLALAARSKS